MDLSYIKLRLASPDDIMSWSYGEITKPETINYRTQKAEREGLFSEAIFGPVKDFECYCGKYKRIRYKGIICDRCGVEVTRSIVRRERMGHIKLASPVAHIWFLRGVPSKIAMVLGVSLPDLEKVVYFASYIVGRVNEDLKTEAMKRIESEFKSRLKTNPDEEEHLREIKETERTSLKSLRKYQVLSELEYRELSLKYGEVFEAGIGAEAIRRLMEEVNLEELATHLEAQYTNESNPLELRKIARRLKLARSMFRAGVRPEWMVMTVLPVIPPSLRPMVPLDGGRFATSDLNDLYRRVINRNNRLKHLVELKAPEVITKNEKRMLQEAVDALIDNTMRRGQTTTPATTGQKRALKSLADMLKGKQGRFRQNLLGKRVDYSGRSVIVIGPHLKMSECGIPKHIALELFKPFVIGILMTKGLAHNIKSAGRLIEQETADVWAALEEAIQGKLVLLNRAPTLHRLGIQAFEPKLIEGKAIQISAMPTHAFNADFDGDQMAVHLPLTDHAQKEARELMLSTHGILKPATGEPVAAASHDISFGCYYLTAIHADEIKGTGLLFSSFDEALLAHENNYVDLRAKIKVDYQAPADVRQHEYAVSTSGIIETSVGRIIFNRKAIPPEYGFVNQKLNKNDLRSIESDIWDEYGEDRTVAFLDAITKLGFEYSTRSGVSWGMDDLRVPAEKTEIIVKAGKLVEENRHLYEEGLLTEHERRIKAIEIWTNAKAELSQFVKKQLKPEDAAYMMVDSKSRGNWGTMDQMMGMRGIMNNPTGELIELPVIDSFKEGLLPLEYFISTHGARKGLVDTALKTASAGYLTRRLVDVAQDVVVMDEDCKDKEGYLLWASDNKYSGDQLGKRLRGRVVLEDILNADGSVLVKKGKVVDKPTAKKIDALGLEKVRIRSLVTCKALNGVCRLCYGYDLTRNELIGLGEAVGIVTAQAIGEPATQLTMRTFHTGGVATAGGDITMGVPRVEEIFECRPPSFKALISETDGKVLSVEDRGKQKAIIIESSETGENHEYLLTPNLAIGVQVGDLVARGQQLSEGHIDLKELYRTTGDLHMVARYIIREVQAIYYPTGDSLNDKHLELIVRQMFSRMLVTDAGSTELLAGDTVEKRRLLEENQRVRADGKPEAAGDQLIMGITGVALSTESFLSASSFQQTTKILTNSAIEGRKDYLRGLKENVIIGRLVPAGTGLINRPTESIMPAADEEF